MQFIVKRARKTGANQTIELSILKKAGHPLVACFFADAGMENLNRAIVDLAVDHFDTIAIARGFLVESAEEFRALRGQSKRDRNHRVICCEILTIKLRKLIFGGMRLQRMRGNGQAFKKGTQERSEENLESGKQERRKNEEKNLESRKPGKKAVEMIFFPGFVVSRLSSSSRFLLS